MQWHHPALFIVCDKGLIFLFFLADEKIPSTVNILFLVIDFLICLKIWGLFLPADVKPMLDSLEGRKHVPERQPSISDVSV